MCATQNGNSSTRLGDLPSVARRGRLGSVLPGSSGPVPPGRITPGCPPRSPVGEGTIHRYSDPVSIIRQAVPTSAAAYCVGKRHVTTDRREPPWRRVRGQSATGACPPSVARGPAATARAPARPRRTAPANGSVTHTGSILPTRTVWSPSTRAWLRSGSLTISQSLPAGLPGLSPPGCPPTTSTSAWWPGSRSSSQPAPTRLLPPRRPCTVPSLTRPRRQWLFSTSRPGQTACVPPVQHR